MENKALFIAYLITWVVSLLTVYVWARRKQLPLAGVLGSHAVPSIVAVVMTYIFLIAGGATVAQLAGEPGMDMWSLWFNLWPLFLICTAASGVINLVLSIIFSMKKSQRRWIPITIAALVMSVFAFFVVGSNFPDA